jgi:hypothetical protein
MDAIDVGVREKGKDLSGRHVKICWALFEL